MLQTFICSFICMKVVVDGMTASRLKESGITVLRYVLHSDTSRLAPHGASPPADEHHNAQRQGH